MEAARNNGHSNLGSVSTYPPLPLSEPVIVGSEAS
jgi:hypothetical protein